MCGLLQSRQEEKLMHNAPRWTENIRAVRVPPAHSSHSINSTSPITSLSDSHDEKRESGREGGHRWRKSHYCLNMQSVWQLQWLSNIIWAGESECFLYLWVGEIEIRSEKGKEETDRRTEGRRERASVQLWGVPSSTKLLQLPSSLLLLLPGRERERATERGRVSNRERVRESRLQAGREETSRGGSTKGCPIC